MTVDPAVPRFLFGDPLRLGQVLINLATNAVKFSHVGGKILIDFSLREEDETSVLLYVRVRDDGIGISAEQKKIIFKSFSQADSSTTRRFGGTGLGLVICQNIVKMMEGEIWLDSEIDRGSTFHFTARLGKARLDAGESRQTEAEENRLFDDAVKRLEHCRVLLVEDNEINQELVLELLESQGLEATVAGHGAEALDILQGSHFDLILMDCSMPVMDGYEATRKIRQRDRLRDIPIIALTANVMQHDREKVLAAGMNDHVGKPVDPVNLFTTMARWYGPLASRRGSTG